MESAKFLCRALTIKDACLMMEFIRLLIFIKTQENRFSQIKNLKKKNHRQKWYRYGLNGIQVVQVIEGIRVISSFFIFFYEKILSEQKAQKRKQATFFSLDIFMCIKMLPFRFLFACLRFVCSKSFCKKIKKPEITLIPSITYTAILKFLLRLRALRKDWLISGQNFQICLGFQHVMKQSSSR